MYTIMDQSLLNQRKAFLDRAKAQPTVEKRKAPKDDKESHSKKQKVSAASSKSKHEEERPKQTFDYKSMPGSSQYKFGILAKIVRYMMRRHQQGDKHPLSIDEILDETNQTDIGSKNRHWLITEALTNNPKIKLLDGGERYAFKPKFEIKDKKSFLNLLKRYDLHGLGGILLEDLEESYGAKNVEKALKTLGNNVITVTRPHDKKKVIFYNDKYCRFTIEEEFTKQWRGVSVEGLDEKKIEEYLEKQGISSMQDMGSKKAITKRKKKGGKKTFKKHNEHLSHVLKDYTET